MDLETVPVPSRQADAYDLEHALGKANSAIGQKPEKSAEEFAAAPGINRRIIDAFALDREVSSTLITVGILPSKTGHGLVRDSIVCKLNAYFKGDKNVKVYVKVSALHGCSQKACESGIRNAIHAAHRSGSLLRLNEILGATVIEKTYAPSNLDFISLLAQHLYYKIMISSPEQI